MSLMNDMLRDLDKRQAPDRSQQVEAQGYGALTQQASSHGSRVILILLSVIIAMLMLLAMAWWYLQSDAQDSSIESGSIQRIAGSTNNSSPDANAISDPTVVSAPTVVSGPAAASNNTTHSNITTDPSIQVEKPVVVSQPKVKQYVVDKEEPVVAVAASPLVAEKVVAADVVVTDVATKASVTKTVDTKNSAPKAFESIAKASTAPSVQPKAKSVEKSKINKVVVLSPEQQDEKAANLATKMLESGESQKATAYLYQFIEQHDVDAQSRAVLVGHLLNNRQMTAAENVLNTTDLSQSSHLRRLKAHWYSLNNQPNEAIAVLNSKVPDVEEDVEYHVLLAALYQQQGYGTEAVARYAELIRYNSDMPGWWAGMAIGLDRSEQYSSAIKAYEKALQMGGLRTELAEFAKQRLETLSD